MKKRLISFLVVATLLLGMGATLSGCGTGNTFAAIEVEDIGTVVIELYPQYAPRAVRNFVKLADSGFYNGLIFHRVISGFMVQGGDPQGTGMGGSDENIMGEFSQNGYVKNTLTHSRGVLSMARSGHWAEQYAAYYGMTVKEFADAQGVDWSEIQEAFDSASSQFYIVHEDSPHLDGNYAGFGMVIHGIEVIDAIAAVATDDNDKPLSDVVMTKVWSMTEEEAEELIATLTPAT